MTTTAVRRRRPRKAVVAQKVAIYVLLVVAASLFLLPVMFTVLTSFKRTVDLYTPLDLSFVPSLANYFALFTERDMADYLLHSGLIATASVLISLLLALFAAYGLARTRVRGERRIALTMLALRTVPAIVLVLPYFLITNFIGLFDTPWILIIAYTTFNLPLAIWLLRGFMRELPRELDEAAQIDGASHVRILFQILLPSMGPAIAATSILMFIQSWNEYVYANVLTSTQAATFPTTVNFFLGINTVAYGQMAAASIIGTIPVILLAALAHKHLVRGLAYGGT